MDFNSRPYWFRLAIVTAAVCLAISVALFGYSYYTRPITLTLAVGSLDGEASKAASLIAGRLAANNAPVRLKVVNTGNIQEAAKAFNENKTDLAVVRADVGDLSSARSVALVSYAAVMIVAPAGSPYLKFLDLKGQTVGVVGGQINHSIVDALATQYDLNALNISFKYIDYADAKKSIQSGDVGALLMVVPLTRRYLGYIASIFRDNSEQPPTLLSIGSAAAIADVEHKYEALNIHQGSLQGAPPVPDSDRTTLRTGLYLVAHSTLDSEVVTSLTREIMSVRRDLRAEEPSLAGLSTPELDSGAYISVHPGAAEYYMGTHKDLLEKWATLIHVLPVIFAVVASILAATLKFLQLGESAKREAALAKIYQLPRRIRSAKSEAELQELEEEVDRILKAQLKKASQSDSTATMLISTTHWLNSLIDRQRERLSGPVPAPVS